jgi:hypothetical protein
MDTRMRPFPGLFLLLPACAMGGALRQATLVGQCAEGDVACSRRHPQAPIAVGTRFYPEVSASIDGSSTPNLVLESAAPDILAVEDGAFVAKRTRHRLRSARRRSGSSAWRRKACGPRH